jgi:ferredoxin-NADP reductase
VARAAVPGRLGRRLAWRVATLRERRAESESASTLQFDVPDWPSHLAGQHVDVRLTAEDGYRTQRSYSIASAPAGELVELTVQRVAGGEVSPYLVDVVEPGDQVELRGPVGGWFVWRPASAEPVLLLAGGSGLVPLMAMIRTRRAEAATAPFRLVYSVRTPADLLYADELVRPDAGVAIAYLYTRAAPPGSPRPPGRLTRADLAGVPPSDCFVCGPTGFVEAAADLLTDLGHDPARIKTERFGPTGG